MHKNRIVGSVVAVAIVAGLAGFYGGILYVKSGQSVRTGNVQGDFAGFMRGGGGGMMRGGNFAGGGLVGGEILSTEEKSLTLKLRDGGSRLVFFSSGTQILKSATGTIKDFVPGEI